jgi:hypothetical protein
MVSETVLPRPSAMSAAPASSLLERMPVQMMTVSQRIDSPVES